MERQKESALGRMLEIGFLIFAGTAYVGVSLIDELSQRIKKGYYTIRKIPYVEYKDNEGLQNIKKVSEII
jgi:hypothetical protein